MANIEIRNVSKSYEGKSVLTNLSLELIDGECFTLLGPSGCGKTVTARLIAGFEKLDSGTILIGGQSMRGAWLPRGMAIQIWCGSCVVSPWNCSAVSRQNTACGTLAATTARPSCSETGWLGGR